MEKRAEEILNDTKERIIDVFLVADCIIKNGVYDERTDSFRKHDAIDMFYLKKCAFGNAHRSIVSSILEELKQEMMVEHATSLYEIRRNFSNCFILEHMDKLSKVEILRDKSVYRFKTDDKGQYREFELSDLQKLEIIEFFKEKGIPYTWYFFENATRRYIDGYELTTKTLDKMLLEVRGDDPISKPKVKYRG